MGVWRDSSQPSSEETGAFGGLQTVEAQKRRLAPTFGKVLLT
jgi:hypothetical protein